MATANERKNDPAGVNARDTGANVTFTRGPVYVFGAWEEHKDQVGGSGNAFGQLPAGTTVVNGVSGAKEEGWSGGGNFSIGPVKLGGQYQEYKKTNRDKQKAWMGNLVWTIGNNQIIYQYMQSKEGKLNTATVEPDCKSNSIAYQYNFSRRTFFIASYVKVDNNDVASCNFGANRLAAANGQDPQGVFGGIRHIF